ncbi:MAG: hypothetical protein KBT30_01915 [Clostridiales bacterium]|nr:hypothetical protein [Candidatus Apopatousia equi]
MEKYNDFDLAKDEDVKSMQREYDKVHKVQILRANKTLQEERQEEEVRGPERSADEVPTIPTVPIRPISAPSSDESEEVVKKKVNNLPLLLLLLLLFLDDNGCGGSFML